jgi:hypothetical protein
MAWSADPYNFERPGIVCVMSFDLVRFYTAELASIGLYQASAKDGFSNFYASSILLGESLLCFSNGLADLLSIEFVPSLCSRPLGF